MVFTCSPSLQNLIEETKLRTTCKEPFCKVLAMSTLTTSDRYSESENIKRGRYNLSSLVPEIVHGVFV